MLGRVKWDWSAQRFGPQRLGICAHPTHASTKTILSPTGHQLFTWAQMHDLYMWML